MRAHVYLWLISNTKDASVRLGDGILDPEKKSGVRKVLRGSAWKTLRALSLPRQFFMVGYVYSPKGGEEVLRTSVYEYLKLHIKGYK